MRPCSHLIWRLDWPQAVGKTCLLLQFTDKRPRALSSLSSRAWQVSDDPPGGAPCHAWHVGDASEIASLSRAMAYDAKHPPSAQLGRLHEAPLGASENS